MIRLTDRIELSDWAQNTYTFRFKEAVDEDKLFEDLDDVIYNIEHNHGVMDYYSPASTEPYFTGFGTDTEFKVDFDKIVALLIAELAKKGYGLDEEFFAKPEFRNMGQDV